MIISFKRKYFGLTRFLFGMASYNQVLIVGDVFGVEHHGANYMFYDGGTKALGTILLSEYLAGNVYEAHVDHGGGGDGSNNICLGPSCFQMTHLVIAGCAVTCIIASLLLCKTSQKAYGRMTK